jgi:tetratricopeptide (TPR) repeat protein
VIDALNIARYLQEGDDAAAMEAIEALVAEGRPDDGLIQAALAVRGRIGPLQVDRQAPHTISLCMIVRDEETFLGPCLHAVKPLVDEIVLVDTGSSDRSREIGHIYGAQVHDFKWCHDFAAARNFGISKASGRWVLVLDADEAIALADFDTLRRLIREHADQNRAFAIETRNYCHTANTFGWRANDGRYPAHETGLGWFPSTKVRLFRRASEVRFRFPVHERVEPSLKAAGIGILKCEVPFHHYGHLNEARNQEKAREYYQLGYAKLREMADDPAAVRELAVQAGQLERWEEAIDLWQHLLAMRPDYPEALINMAAAHWQLGRYSQSLAWAQKAVARKGDLKEAHFNMALSLMMRADFSQAAAILENLLKKQSDYLAAGFMLAVTYACSAQKKKAVSLIGRLRQTPAAPAIPKALGDICQRLRSAGHGDAARQIETTLSTT